MKDLIVIGVLVAGIALQTIGDSLAQGSGLASTGTPAEHAMTTSGKSDRFHGAHALAHSISKER